MALPICVTRAADVGVTKFEAVPQGETQEIDEMVDLTHKLLARRYGDATGETMARRAVHPKAHGCVKADYTVNADSPRNIASVSLRRRARVTRPGCVTLTRRRSFGRTKQKR